MSKAKSGSKGGKKGGPSREEALERKRAKAKYVEMRGNGKTPRQIRAVAVARNDEWLVEFCEGIIDGTRKEPAIPPRDESPAGGDPEPAGVEEAADASGDGDAESETGDTEEAAEAEDMTEPGEDGGGDSGEAESTSGEDERGDTVRVARRARAAMERAIDDHYAGVRDGGDHDGGADESGAEDTRPVVTVEELRAIDLELAGLANRFRETAGEMSRLRVQLDELKRTRRAMGPAARERRAGGTRARGGAGPRPISLLTAAADLLAETGQTMNSRQIVRELGERGTWSSPAGKTPDATLYSSANREVIEKGEQSRFVRAGKGQFAASEYGLAQYKAARENAAANEADGADGADQETD